MFNDEATKFGARTLLGQSMYKTRQTQRIGGRDSKDSKEDKQHL